MTTSFNDSDHPRSAQSGEFTTKPQSDPELALTASGLSTLRVGSHSARAALVAGAGNHHVLFLHNSSSAADADELVNEIARLSGGKAITRITPDTTAAQLIGRPGAPGLLAEANDGILVIERAAEVSATILDALRPSLEIGAVTVSRAGESETFASKFQLIVLSQECACGNSAACSCTAAEKRRYLRRLPGPLVDRISMQSSIVSGGRAGDFGDVDDRVATAKAITAERLAGTPWSDWSEVPGSFLRTGDARLPTADTEILDRSLERGGVTMRGYDRILRTAWTLAALDGKDKPTAAHVASAAELRRGPR